MIKSRRLVGMPVISVGEGNEIGKVKDLVINPDSKVVAALIIEEKGFLKGQKFIPYSKVSSIGSDAITIEKSSSATKGASIPDIVQLTKDKHSLTGCKVVAEKGTVLGTVEEYYINVEDGSLSGFEISGSFISGIMSGRAFLDISLVRTIGKKILVVSNDASENLVKIDGGLWETLKTIKDAGSSLWETTVVKAREVTGTINKRLEQLKNERKKALEHSDQCQCSSCAPSTPSPKENNPQTGPAGDEEKISAAVQNNPQEEQAAADEKKAEKDENHSHQK